MLEGMLATRSGRNMLDLTTWGPAYYEKHTLPYPFIVHDSGVHHRELAMDQTPYGEDVVFLSTSDQYQDTSTNFVGGWDTALEYLKIDPTKKYRFSVWVKVNNQYMDAANSIYMGCNRTPEPNLVENVVTGVIDANPYFIYLPSTALPQNEWVLIYGHVYPRGTRLPVAAVECDILRTNGESLGHLAYSRSGFCWGPNCTYAQQRVYSYYGSKTGSDASFYHPRIEICDGSEPSIVEILNRRID